MSGISIEWIDGGRTLATLDELHQALGNTEPLMRDVEAMLVSESERQFKTQSGPGGPWPALTETTLAMRAARGVAGAPMLQISAGGLAASVQGGHTETDAWVGSNKPYAAMQFFGGVTSPQSMIPNKRIRARPYLPFDPDTEQLTPEAEETLMDVLAHHVGTR